MMLPIQHRILSLIGAAERASIITGPKALATLAYLIKQADDPWTARVVRLLHREGYIATNIPRRPKSPVRFRLTDRGREALKGRIAA